MRLEWVAVAHFNTDHPHVHIALRGRTEIGPLRLERDYVKHGIRQHTENLCNPRSLCTQVDPSFLSTLRAMQITRDHQRMLALTGRVSHGGTEARDNSPSMTAHDPRYRFPIEPDSLGCSRPQAFRAVAS